MLNFITTCHIKPFFFPFFQDILDKARPLSPRALVIDSIQTVYLQGVTGSAGSISQVQYCLDALVSHVK